MQIIIQLYKVLYNNSVLIKFDLYIDFYPRVELESTHFWVIPDVYLPIL